MPLSPDQIWPTALEELQLQLTGATFETWLSRSHLVAFEDGTCVVGVPDTRAKDWLENRLLSTIERTLTGLVGSSTAVRFVVLNKGTEKGRIRCITDMDNGSGQQRMTETQAEPLPEMPALGEVGFFPVSRYECTFWAPLLGRVAWRVWEIVRGADIRKEKSDWTPERRWSAPELARLVPCGPQAIVGVNREAGRRAGALDRLAESEVGRHRRQGDAHDPHTMYAISVRVRLPLLSAMQVMQLSDTLRHRHDRWLEEHNFDPRDWFVAGA